jgi:hypothetical protein
VSDTTSSAPPFPLKSRDGVAFPAEGVTFEITRTVDGEEKIIPFTLFETLVGLNLTPNSVSGKSQAEVFASFALGAGFTSEAEILERWPKYHARQNTETKEWFSTARRQIDIWDAEAKERSADKAMATMEGKDSKMSVEQKSYAIRLCASLKEYDGNVLAKELWDLTQRSDDPKPLGGQLSRTIARAEAWLKLVTPKEWTPPAPPQTDASTSAAATGSEMVGDKVDESDLTGLEGLSSEEIIEIHSAFCNEDPF